MHNKLESLAQEWAAAKREEESARDRRVGIEAQILALHPAKEEGAESFELPNGAKVTLTGKLTYGVDVEQLQALTASWPAEIKPYKVEVKPDESRLKAIRRDVPKLWAEIAPAVTVKPAKTNVTVKMPEVTV